MATVQYMNVKTAAGLWGLTERRVRILCSEGRVDGVIRNGWAWNIPVGTPKPQDGRSLRHIKNTSMRPGAANYRELDALQASLAGMKTGKDRVLAVCRNNLPTFVSGALALDGIAVDEGALAAVLAKAWRDSVTYEEAMLALNCRHILLGAVQACGLGPVPGGAVDQPFLSEQKLRRLEGDLLHGIDDMPSLAYRRASLPAGSGDDGKTFTVEQQMAIMMMQYEKEWQMLHPLVRASFLFGELTRIRPFGRYDHLFALLAMSLDLLASGYPYAVVDADQAREVNADLALTRARGNYQALIALFEHSLVSFLKDLIGAES